MLLGLAGLLGSRLGQLWVAFDVFAQFTLHFGLITLAFLVGWLMPRARLLTAVVILLAGIVAIGAWPHLASRGAPGPVPVAAAGEKALRVASFNTLYVNTDANAVAAEIRRLDADVVALIEMGPGKRQILEDLRDSYPHQVTCFAIDYCNLAILSKLPLSPAGAEVRWEGPPYLAARLGPEAGAITIVAAHTIRFPHSRAQFRQAVALGDMIEGMPGRKVVMGDFNATPFSRIIETVETRGSLIRLTDLPSWPSHLGLPQIAIDHIFVSPGIRALSRSVIGEPAGSDHYPVMVDIAVPLRP